MTLFGIFLALFSAITQASAHAVLKHSKDRMVMRSVLGLICGVMALPLLLFIPDHIWPSPTLWFWLGATTIVHTVYMLVVFKAYESDDFSITFPIARGIVPMASALLGIFILGDGLTLPVFLGICGVTLGVISLAQSSQAASDNQLKLFSAGVGFALLAGAFTTTYSLIDAHGVRIAPTAFTFIVWMFVLDGWAMTALALYYRRGKYIAAAAGQWKMILLGAILTFCTYGAAMYAMRILDIGVALSLRETGAVWGVIIAAVFLKEKITIGKIISTGIIAASAIFILLNLEL